MGFMLSFVFLLFFVYMVSGAQWIFTSSLQDLDGEKILGSLTDSIQNVSALDYNSNSSDDFFNMPAHLDINSESAVSVEGGFSGSSKTIFTKNGDLKLPIASLTKLMTAVIVLDNYNMSTVVSIGEQADMQDSMKQDVKLGDMFSVEDLLKIMLIESSNKSAYALSMLKGEEKFVDLMNQKTRDLGLENTFFTDPTGLSSQNVSTANDLAKLATHIVENYPKIADISREEKINVPNFGEVVNSNQLLGEIPEIICSKTGFTTAAKGCLLVVINSPNNNGYLINVILGADDRFSEMKKLINWSSATCK
jgi:D-alanyl-D-alanine carboxypeptidase (penicillin-binding protein 5/6)